MGQLFARLGIFALSVAGINTFDACDYLQDYTDIEYTAQEYIHKTEKAEKYSDYYNDEIKTLYDDKDCTIVFINSHDTGISYTIEMKRRPEDGNLKTPKILKKN